MKVKITKPDGTVIEFEMDAPRPSEGQTNWACPKHGSGVWMAIVPPPCTCGQEFTEVRTLTTHQMFEPHPFVTPTGRWWES